MAGVFLVDGTNLLYRAYHALRGFQTSRGLPTHVAYGFLTMVLRLRREHSPDVLAVVFDPPGPTQKHKLSAVYKANRERTPDDLVVQIPFVHRLLDGLGVPRLTVPGYEADDVLGTLARRYADEGHQVTLVTGDKDFCQLVGGRVRLLDTMKERITGPDDVKERLGVPPDRVVDFLALTGDAVDNVAGVPGVGPKTAAQLLEKYGTLEGVVAGGGGEKGKKGEALREHGARALANRALVTIDTDVPLGLEPGALDGRPMDRAALAETLRELELHRLLKDLGLEGEPPQAPQAVIEVARPADPPPAPSTQHALALFTPRGGGPWACATPEGEVAVFSAARPPTAWAERLASPEVSVVGHGLKAALLELARNGCPPPRVGFDCEVAAYLLLPGRRDYALDDLARGRGVELGSRGEGEPEGTGARAAALLALGRVLEDELRQNGMWALYRDLENPLIPVLAGMEGAGVRVDSAVLGGLSREYGGRLSALEAEMFAEAGETFSPQSPKQLARILFEKLKLPSGRKTATGYSTDAAVLEELALLHPLPAQLLAHRSLAKLKGTFIDVLPRLVDLTTGRIHARFHQTVAATGRLSSSDPNLQNIPVKGDEGRRIRQAFVAADGYALVSSDYSQVELRVLAHLSGDPALLSVFQAGRDIHAETASRVFGVPLDEVDGRMRREAKTVNFGILYGISPFGLARQLGIGREAAQRMIDAYFRQFPGVRAFLEGLVESARTRGYAETLFGRRRPIPEVSSRNRVQREFGERMAVNTPIQGTAADLIKRAMIGCVEALNRAKCDARLILQVHDELVFEVARGQVDEVVPLVTAAMEGAAELSVPLSVEAGWGLNWYDAHR